MGERRGTKALELWCRRITDGYPGVKVDNMTTSWRDGLAFCALIHHFRPDLIDFSSLKKEDVYHNNELAFRTAESYLGIPALLDAEDMAQYAVPDRLSILTYLSQYYQHFASTSGASPSRLSGKRTSPSTERSPHPASPSSAGPPTKMFASGLGRREPCVSCEKPVFLAQRLVVDRRLYHRTCFRCARCDAQLSLASCYQTETDGQYCCETCPDEESDRGDEIDSEETESISTREGSLSTDISLRLTENLEKILSDEEKSQRVQQFQDVLAAENAAFHDSLKEHSTVSSSTPSKALTGFLSSQFDQHSDDDEIVPALPTSRPPVNLTSEPVFSLNENPPLVNCDVKSENVSDIAVGQSVSMFDLKDSVNLKQSDNTKLMSDVSCVEEKPLEQSVSMDEYNKRIPGVKETTSIDEIINTVPIPAPRGINLNKGVSNVNNEKLYVNQHDTASDLITEIIHSNARDDSEVSANNDVIAKENQISEKSNNFDDRKVVDEEINHDNSTPSLVKMRMKLFEAVSPDKNRSSNIRLSSTGSQKELFDQNNVILSNNVVLSSNKTYDNENVPCVIDSLPYNDSTNFDEKQVEVNSSALSIESTVVLKQGNVKEKIVDEFPDNSVIIENESVSNDSKHRIIDSSAEVCKVQTAISKLISDGEIFNESENMDLENKLNINAKSSDSMNNIEENNKELVQLDNSTVDVIEDNALDDISNKQSEEFVDVQSNNYNDSQKIVEEIVNNDVDSIKEDNNYDNDVDLIKEDNNDDNDVDLIKEDNNDDNDVDLIKEDNNDDNDVDLIKEDNNDDNDVDLIKEDNNDENDVNLIKEDNNDDNDIDLIKEDNNDDNDIDLIKEDNNGDNNVDLIKEDKNDEAEEEKDLSITIDHTQNEEFESKISTKEIPTDNIESQFKAKMGQKDQYPDDLNPFSSDDEEKEEENNLKISSESRDVDVFTTPPKKISTNPFGSCSEDEDDTTSNTNVPVRKKSGEKPPRPPPPVILVNAMKHNLNLSEPKKKIIPAVGLNPFGSDDESEDDTKREVPVASPRNRTNDNLEPSPMPRASLDANHPPPSFHGSSSSLSGTISRKKKAPAPKPPADVFDTPKACPRKSSLLGDETNDNSLMSNLSSPNSSMTSLQMSPRSRKRRPAPAPPTAHSTFIDSPSMDYQSLNVSGPTHPRLSTMTATDMAVLSPINATSNINVSLTNLSSSGKKIISAAEFDDPDHDMESSGNWDGDKSSKNENNKNRQSADEKDLLNASLDNKSTSGVWKRRKGPAPAVPLISRRIPHQPMPPAALRRELALLEEQQRGLEKQGVRLEEIIRDRTEGKPEDGAPDPETDELVLQLFELVNEKNELFRRQAELMYIRRQQRLEEEQADLEHQVRQLMSRPEANKTDADKTREEALLQRLLEVVRRRDEVVAALEAERVRERREDTAIRERMAAHRAKLEENNSSLSSSADSQLQAAKKEKKKDKKKWIKRDKVKKSDAKASDESESSITKKDKKHKKWFQ